MPDDKIRRLNEKALISHARCQATYNHLSELGLTGVELRGCPTLFLNEIADRLPPIPASSQNLVLLSVRNPALMSMPTELRSRVRSDIYGIVEALEKAGYPTPHLLCHDYRDIEFASSFRNIVYHYIDDAATFLSVLRAARMNVSYRLHSVLPCLVFGVPVVGISYDERALSLMDTVGYGTWDIDMVKSSDVPADVFHRLENLDKLVELRKHAGPTWSRLRDANRKDFLSFASAVRRFRDESH